jgi:hypothetical protein
MKIFVFTKTCCIFVSDKSINHNQLKRGTAVNLNEQKDGT